MTMKLQQEVLMEFEPMGKYKVRLVREGTRIILDIREFIASSRFTGYTRRGIRLTTSGELTTLSSILESLHKNDPFSGQSAQHPLSQ